MTSKIYKTALPDKNPLNDSPLKSIPRSWVKLEDIMWTLEPEEFFPVIFPDLHMTYADFKLNFTRRTLRTTCSWLPWKRIRNQ